MRACVCITINGRGLEASHGKGILVVLGAAVVSQGPDLLVWLQPSAVLAVGLDKELAKP